MLTAEELREAAPLLPLPPLEAGVDAVVRTVVDATVGVVVEATVDGVVASLLPVVLVAAGAIGFVAVVLAAAVVFVFVFVETVVRVWVRDLVLTTVVARCGVARLRCTTPALALLCTDGFTFTGLPCVVCAGPRWLALAERMLECP